MALTGAEARSQGLMNSYSVSVATVLPIGQTDEIVLGLPLFDADALIVRLAELDRSMPHVGSSKLVGVVAAGSCPQWTPWWGCP